MSRIASIDRRVARTRKTLQHALLTLILKKGYEAISVEEICAEANVGRSTFYAHFIGKNDLKRAGLDSHLRMMLTERRTSAEKDAASAERFRFALPFLWHAHDHLDLYRALVSMGGVSTTIEMIRQLVAEQVRCELAEIVVDNSPEAPPREAVTQFVVGAFMSLLTWWLDGGATLSPERVDAIFKSLAIEGVKRIDNRQ